MVGSVQKKQNTKNNDSIFSRSCYDNRVSGILKLIAKLAT